MGKTSVEYNVYLGEPGSELPASSYNKVTIYLLQEFENHWVKYGQLHNKFLNGVARGVARFLRPPDSWIPEAVRTERGDGQRKIEVVLQTENSPLLEPKHPFAAKQLDLDGAVVYGNSVEGKDSDRHVQKGFLENLGPLQPAMRYISRSNQFSSAHLRNYRYPVVLNSADFYPFLLYSRKDTQKIVGEDPQRVRVVLDCYHLAPITRGWEESLLEEAAGLETKRAEIDGKLSELRGKGTRSIAFLQQLAQRNADKPWPF